MTDTRKEIDDILQRTANDAYQWNITQEKIKGYLDSIMAIFAKQMDRITEQARIDSEIYKMGIEEKLRNGDLWHKKDVVKEVSKMLTRQEAYDIASDIAFDERDNGFRDMDNALRQAFLKGKEK